MLWIYVGLSVHVRVICILEVEVHVVCCCSHEVGSYAHVMLYQELSKCMG